MNISDDVYCELMSYHTVPTLITTIKECYDAKTIMIIAIDVSLLFTTREYVTQFDQMLDKLEQLYNNLAQHDKAFNASTYVSTINLMTSQ